MSKYTKISNILDTKTKKKDMKRKLYNNIFYEDSHKIYQKNLANSIQRQTMRVGTKGDLLQEHMTDLTYKNESSL